MPVSRQLEEIPPLRTHPHLYEINTWAWIDEQSRAAGRELTLADVSDAALDEWEALGFDMIWLMGIWKRSAAGRALDRNNTALFEQYDLALPGWQLSDVAGSPYAVADYSPDSRLGGWQALDQFRARSRHRGLRLMLDFVPNHTAIDHPWITSHPEFYVEGSFKDFRQNTQAFFLVEGQGQVRILACGKDPYFAPWTDTAQINYWNPAARRAMIAELHKIAEHCDGVRCDMAMLALNSVFERTWGSQLTGFVQPQSEFWPAATSSLPGFIFMGEVYWDLEWDLQQMGFQFTYDKRLYDRLLKDSPYNVMLHLTAGLDYQSKLARFLENHDEQRAVTAFGEDRLLAALVLAATLPGMRFYHQGQLEGRAIQLPIQLRGMAAEPVRPKVQELYQKALNLTHAGLFHDGEWKLLRVAGGDSSRNLIAHQWRRAKDWSVIVVNLSDSPSSGNVALDVRLRPPATCRFTDQLSGKRQDLPAQSLNAGGLPVALGPYGSMILSVNEL